MIDKFLSISTLLAVVVSVFGQAPPNGGGGGIGGGDHWVVDSVSRNGHVYGYDYNYIGGIALPVPFDLPWSSGLERVGAVNYTNESHEVQITTEGTITYHMRWSGASAPPTTQVLVRIYSQATGSYSPSGSANADNGLGSPALPMTNPDGVYSLGSKMKVYNCGGGTFDITVSVYAQGIASGVGANANAVKSTLFEILNRGLGVESPGHTPNYRKKMTGQTVYSRGGSYPGAQPEMSMPEEDGTGALSQSIFVGIPIVTRDYFDNNNSYTHIDAHAWTWGDHQPTELFQWHTPMDNTSGSLPSLWTGYEIGDAGVVNFSWAVKELDGTLTINGANSMAEGTITYSWSDNFELTAKLRAFSRLIRDNHYLFQSIDYTEDGQLTWDISQFALLESDPIWSEPYAPSIQCRLLPRDAELSAAGHLASIVVATGSEFPEPWPIRLAFIAAGLAMEAFPLDDDPITYYESLTKFQESVARTPEYGSWVDKIPLGPITEETMHEYVWQVMALPLYQTDWYAADKWGANGYEGQEEESVRWQKSVRYGYRYKAIQPGGLG